MWITFNEPNIMADTFHGYYNVSSNEVTSYISCWTSTHTIISGAYGPCKSVALLS